MFWRHFCHGLVAAMGVSFALVGGTALGEEYPTRSIRMVVPFPPGGTVDIVGRAVAHELGKRVGVPVVVDNKAGAGGAIGASEVARAKPDGYTLLVAATHHSINPSLHKNLPYDPKELIGIARVITTPSVLVVGAATPFGSVKDLIAAAIRKESKLNYGSTGMGGVNHLTAELFKSVTGVQMQHIPYKGAAPAMADLLGGQIPIMFDSPPTVVEHVRSGRIRALAVSGAERSSLLPDVPTFQEAGIANFEAQGWVGIMGPANLSEEIRSKLSNAINDYLDSPEAKAKFSAMGIDVAPLSHERFDEYFRQELRKWSVVIGNAGIAVE